MGRQVNFKIGIIGCGLIGYKRAKSLGPKGKLIACADPNINQAKRIVRNKKVKIFTNWKKLLEIKEIDIVIISTPHNQLTKILLALSVVFSFSVSATDIKITDGTQRPGHVLCIFRMLNVGQIYIIYYYLT